tara:strand:- start:530 stop:790 length:261 start_codon:yes stop_codon:yes gene_type:complete
MNQIIETREQSLKKYRKQYYKNNRERLLKNSKILNKEKVECRCGRWGKYNSLKNQTHLQSRMHQHYLNKLSMIVEDDIQIIEVDLL